MKTYLLVFDDGNGPAINLQAFLNGLDEKAQLYTLDGHVCFIRSEWDAAALSEAFLPLAGSSLFFVTQMSTSDFAGRMVGPFWDFLRAKGAVATAA